MFLSIFLLNLHHLHLKKQEEILLNQVLNKNAFRFLLKLLLLILVIRLGNALLGEVLRKIKGSYCLIFQVYLATN
jgi:hypothetical protein